MKHIRIPTIIGIIAMSVLSACSNPYNEGDRAIGGGLLGAGTGAAIGALAGGGNGAAIGALAGGALGAGAGALTTPNRPNQGYYNNQYPQGPYQQYPQYNQSYPQGYPPQQYYRPYGQ